MEGQLNTYPTKAKKLINFSVEKEGFINEFELYYLVINDGEIEIYQQGEQSSIFLDTVYINGIGAIGNVTKVVINALSEILLPLAVIKISYISSSYYTLEEFNKILKKAEESFEFDVNNEKQRNSEIFKVCEALNLNPEYMSEIDSWYARCPSRMEHYILLNANSSTWQCEKCNRNGGVEALKNWQNETDKN